MRETNYDRTLRKMRALYDHMKSDAMLYSGQRLRYSSALTYIDTLSIEQIHKHYHEIATKQSSLSASFRYAILLHVQTLMAKDAAQRERSQRSRRGAEIQHPDGLGIISHGPVGRVPDVLLRKLIAAGHGHGAALLPVSGLQRETEQENHGTDGGDSSTVLGSGHP